MPEFRRVEGLVGLREVWGSLSGSFDPPLAERSWDFGGYLGKLAEHAVSIACYEGGSLAGCVSFYANDEEGGIAFVSLIATSPLFRRCGIGRGLLEEAERAAVSAGMGRMRLEVRRDNETAICFYRDNGFAPEGNGGAGESLYMVRDLEGARG